MKFAIAIAIVLGLLFLWRLAWRTRPVLAFGITIGIMIGWIFAVVVGNPELETIPLWLPPLPFAVVAVTLFAFGVLAWVWGDEDERSARQGEAGQSSHGH